MDLSVVDHKTKKTFFSKFFKKREESAVSLEPAVVKENVKERRFLEVIPRRWDSETSDWYEEIREPQRIRPIVLVVEADLSIVCKSRINSESRLLKCLEVILDEYHGCIANKDYYLMIYLLLAAKLTRSNYNSELSIYESAVSEAIRFGIRTGATIKERDEYHCWFQFGKGSGHFSIKFAINIKPSKRKGIIYPELYNLKGYNTEFKVLMKALDLNLMINDEGLVCPQ